MDGSLCSFGTFWGINFVIGTNASYLFLQLRGTKVVPLAGPYLYTRGDSPEPLLAFNASYLFSKYLLRKLLCPSLIDAGDSTRSKAQASWT